MSFHTFADGTMIKLSSIDVIGPIIPHTEFWGPVPPFVPEGAHAYRIITLGFSGLAGALGINPLVRYSADLQALTAERDALIAAVLAQP